MTVKYLKDVTLPEQAAGKEGSIRELTPELEHSLIADGYAEPCGEKVEHVAVDKGADRKGRRPADEGSGSP